MRRVQIDWEDPFSTAGWVEREPAVEEALTRSRVCHTIGWVLHEDDRIIVVAGSVGVTDSDQVGDVFEIPKRVVDRVVELDGVSSEVY